MESRLPTAAHEKIERLSEQQPHEWKHTGKVVQAVGLGGIAVSTSLIMNAPPVPDTHRVIYPAYLTVVGLGIFTGIGLSLYSFFMKRSPAVWWVQKRLVFFTFFFVGVACFLRIYLALPSSRFFIGTAAVLVGVTVLVIGLHAYKKFCCREHEPDPEH